MFDDFIEIPTDVVDVVSPVSHVAALGTVVIRGLQ